MTTGQKIEVQLDELEVTREELIDNLEAKGITGLSGDETLDELVPQVLNLDINDGYRFTKLGLSPINKTSYLDYQDELDKVDFCNFKLDSLFANSYLSSMPNFNNCKNINTITTADKIFQQAVIQNGSTSKPFIIKNLPSHLTSLNNAFEKVPNVDLTDASFPNIVSASKIFAFDDTNNRPVALNVINHEGSNFDNITDASYFYSNRNITFYNQDLTKFTDSINGNTFTGTIYTLRNKTFPNLTNAAYFQYNYYYSSQKAVKIENCNFPNLTNLIYAFAGMSASGGGDQNNGITHFYIKNCTFDKALNLTNTFDRRYALNTIILDCPNKIPVSNMRMTFYGLRFITNWSFLNNLDVSSCTNFNSTFYGCQGMTELDLTSWDTTAYDLTSTFCDCVNLTSLKIPNIKVKTNLVITSWPTINSLNLQHLDIRSMELSKCTTNYALINAPANCEIIVKDATEKTWWNTKYPTYTNVKTAAEYEAEQN